MANKKENNKENEAVSEVTEQTEAQAEACKDTAEDKKVKNDEAAKKLIAELLEENDKLKKEAAEQKDMHLRMLAEYENFRRRTASEKSQIYADASAEAITKMLPVLDNLERAADCPAETEEGKAIREGVALVLRSFREAFEKQGVEEIAALGETFDPNFHNAVMREDNPEKGEGEITEVFSKGYKIGNKVIRYAMVKVAN